ncbi:MULTISPECIES: hypothetical protein [unclassified Nostoc]|uniref:hypothetical protein n=1 Tax=unclassified Nostoc TaxID=2593658 RepID=UPI002AD36B5C|nr:MULTISPECIES: hypothetical protein [unclassified Nostoc]MDZ8121295.1 hypothetical protein [Nostoc sp. CmiVER01]MDZ8224226.1 hypothetical protein [Nostoc sp. ChiVER01]
MANQIETNLFEELSDSDSMAVVGGAFIGSAEQGATALANGTLNDGVGSQAFIIGTEQGATALTNGTLATQSNIVRYSTEQLGTNGQ